MALGQRFAVEARSAGRCVRVEIDPAPASPPLDEEQIGEQVAEWFREFYGARPAAITTENPIMPATEDRRLREEIR